MSTTYQDLAVDWIYCELCDNYCPRDVCAECGDAVCEYCLTAYGCELAHG